MKNLVVLLFAICAIAFSCTDQGAQSSAEAKTSEMAESTEVSFDSIKAKEYGADDKGKQHAAVAER